MSACCNGTAVAEVQGTTAHGIGNSLYEWMIYDADVQPLTTTFADYLLPSADEIPAVAALVELIAEADKVF